MYAHVALEHLGSQPEEGEEPVAQHVLAQEEAADEEDEQEEEEEQE